MAKSVPHASIIKYTQSRPVPPENTNWVEIYLGKLFMFAGVTGGDADVVLKIILKIISDDVNQYLCLQVGPAGLCFEKCVKNCFG